MTGSDVWNAMSAGWAVATLFGRDDNLWVTGSRATIRQPAGYEPTGDAPAKFC